MKRFLKISALFLLYLLFCGKSCGDDESRTLREEQELNTVKDSLRQELERDYLTEEAKYAAEISAIQKLSDLADYLNIYSDISMDTLFRAKAGEMIKDNFTSEQVRLSFTAAGDEHAEDITLRQFFDHKYKDGFLKANFVFDSIRLIDPIQKTRATVCTGKLGAVQTVIYYTLSDTVKMPGENITIEIITSRQEKIFGKDTMNIWVVFLGDMAK